MSTSIADIPKRKGRPKSTGRGEGVLVRLQPETLQRLDSWIEKQPDPKPTRPAAIRSLVEAAITLGGLDDSTSS
ncbi:hypothetical protein V5F34_08445 [Xanthobacter autotrophicus]|uniref:hypothetical protein n=1 Tax=Xanthobacter autotrophicus TaxID=280 RepID=UPI0037294653